MDEQQFLRTEMLLGRQAMDKLAKAHVAVFGIGGVGSWCAEALARAGIGTLTLVDHDTVGLTNLNRQAEALHSTLGLEKTEAMAQRIRDISPGCVVRQIPEKYEEGNREAFFQARYDYIVDAIDLVSCKLDLIQTALDRGIPILSSMGTGNKLHPELFSISDISQTSVCPLCRVMRKELKARNISHLKVCWSPEPPLTPGPAEEDTGNRRATPGSISFVPPVAGLLIAGQIVRDICGLD